MREGIACLPFPLSLSVSVQESQSQNVHAELPVNCRGNAVDLKPGTVPGFNCCVNVKRHKEWEFNDMPGKNVQFTGWRTEKKNHWTG